MTASRGIGRGGPPGDDHPRAILTTAKVQEMRRMVARGNTHHQAADWAGCSYATARDAVTGATWAHVEDPPPVRRLHRWTAAELAELATMNDIAAADVAAKLGRTEPAVFHQRSKRRL